MAQVVNPSGRADAARHDQGNLRLYECLSDYLIQKAAGEQVEWTDLHFCDFEGWQFVLAPRPDQEDALFDVRLTAPLLSDLLGGGKEYGQSSIALVRSMFDDLAELVFPTKDNEELHLELRWTDLMCLPSTELRQLAKNIAELRPTLMCEPLRAAVAKEQLTRFSIRPQEDIWVVPQEDFLCIYLSMHYGDEDDASLGRVFAQEVHSVFERNRSAVSMRVDYLPETLDAAIFEELPPTTAANVGYFCFTISRASLDEGFTPAMTREVCFLRQYVTYHVKSSKCHMHAHLRKYVTQLERKLVPRHAN